MTLFAASYSFQAEGGTALAVLLALALLPFLARYLVRYLAFRFTLRLLQARAGHAPAAMRHRAA